MEPAMEVTGIAQVVDRMHVVRGETAVGTQRGLVKAGITLQRRSQAVVPVDTGRLKASAFTRMEGSGFATKVTVGYTTDYAVFVHENLSAWHNPGKYAKFLTRPALENRELLQSIIREEAAKGSRGSMPQLLPPAIGAHALLPIPPRGHGSAVTQVSGRRVTYVRKANSKSGRGGWRRKR